MNLVSKIVLPFLLVIVFFFIGTRSSYFTLLEQRESMHREMAANAAGLERFSAFKNDLLEIKANLYRLSVWSIAGVAQNRRENSANDIRTSLKTTNSTLRKYEEEGTSNVDTVRSFFDAFSRRVNGALSIMEKNAFAGATATRALDNLFLQLAASTDIFATHAKDEMQAKTRAADQEAMAAVQQFAQLSIVVLLMTILLILIVYLHISRPIRRLVKCIAALERGTDRVEVPYCNRTDEVGHVARALQSFSETLLARRELEIKLFQQKEQALELAAVAETASAAKSTFLANMSHEIRTPMNAVLGMAELLQETELNEKQSFFANTIFSSSTALLRIINEILDLSKIEAGKLDLEPVAFNLPGTVDEVVRLLGSTAQEKGIEIAVHCDPSFPQLIKGDPGRIRQVLTNLIGNAVKFTDQGSVQIFVKSKVLDKRVLLRVEIEDTGIGIAEKKLDKIFESFTQAENSTTRKYGGTGLGLSISSSLIDAMGGKIGVISEPDQGSTFWFELNLPMVAFEMPHSKQSVEANSGAQTTSTNILTIRANEAGDRSEKNNAKKTRLLIADDNHLNRILLENMIDGSLHDLFFAENGHIAATMARDMEFDLILMDISMPELDGVDATRAIREHEAMSVRRNVPIIALTAHTMANDQNSVLYAGMNDYLTKPLRKADLTRIIETWLKHKPITDAASA